MKILQGPVLVASVELIVPANKDRDESRFAFAIKCASYLNNGIGLIVVDVISSYPSHPLEDIVSVLSPTHKHSPKGNLSAISLRPIRSERTGSIELRIRDLIVGSELPILPLFLDKGKSLDLNLESSYQDARERSRL